MCPCSFMIIPHTHFTLKSSYLYDSWEASLSLMSLKLNTVLQLQWHPVLHLWNMLQVMSTLDYKCTQILGTQNKYSCDTLRWLNTGSKVFAFTVAFAAVNQFKWGGKKAPGGNSTGEKCELLAPVAAQPQRLPMWKGPTVNSPLRWAQSRGNASQSPACSPTWEQLQPPSASSSW